jgi:serpin B
MLLIIGRRQSAVCRSVRPPNPLGSVGSALAALALSINVCAAEVNPVANNQRSLLNPAPMADQPYLKATEAKGRDPKPKLPSMSKSVTDIGCLANHRMISRANTSNAETNTRSFDYLGYELLGYLTSSPRTSETYSRTKAPQATNLVFSPYSVGEVLGMLRAGARSETGTEISHVLGWPDVAIGTQTDQVALPQTQRKCSAQDEFSPQLFIANGLIIKKRISAVAGYLSRIREEYGAEIFQNASPDQVNHWVEVSTAGKINKIIDLPLDQKSAAIAVSAIYFKARWLLPFPKEWTSSGKFMLSNTRSIRIPMMRRAGRFATVTGESLRAIRLPYAGEDSALAMIVVVPNDPTWTAHEMGFTNTIQIEKLITALQNASQQRLWLEMPRFEIEQQFDLAKPLQALGMKRAFETGADFSGIVSSGLRLGAIQHRAMISVTEDGTEAAATTTALVEDAASPPSFKIDRPFLFFVVHEPNRAILFAGQVVEPVAAKSGR